MTILTEEADVHELVKNVAGILRRYAADPEILHIAASLLRPYHNQEQFTEFIETAVNSPTINTKVLFTENSVQEITA